MKIGFFDSGLGGLTVFNEAIKKLQPYEYIYMADNKNAPYGVKDKDIVRGYIFNCIEELIKLECDIIVVACNTATSVAIDDIRKKYSNKIIIGTEPAIKVAAKENNEKRILLCATSITINEQKLLNLIKRLEIDDKVDLIALDKLVKFVESENTDFNEVDEYLKEKFENINTQNYSHVVLGCTHFPLLKENIKRFFTESTKIVDGSIGIVNNLKNKIMSFGENSSLDRTRITLVLTKESDIFVNNFKKISDLDDFKVKIVEC